jgi:hypothetical protein
MVHGTEYGTGEELVINPECFPDAKVSSKQKSKRMKLND